MIAKNLFTFYSRIVALNVNKCVSTLLYNKVLKMSQKSLAVTSTGKLVTLVSSELSTIEKAFGFVPALTTGVVVFFVVIGYVAIFFAEASAIGLVIVVAMLCMFLSVSPCHKRWMYMIGVFSDKRINIITDIINGIKTIKAYRWERIMERKVKKYRDLQLKNIKSYYIFISIGSVVLFSSGYIFVLVVLLYHWGTERKLEYSSSVVLMSVGTYLSLSVIVVFLNGFAITLKIQSIFRRVNEVLNTKDKQINDELKDDNTIADNIV